MKKLVSAVLCIAMAAIMLTACGNKKETLKIGMEIGYPPYEMFSDDGVTPIGLDIDMAKAIAEDIGVEPEFINTGFDGILAGLDRGDYDCVISGLTITDERMLNYDFTQSYVDNYQCMVTLKDAAVTATCPEELEGYKVAFQEETTSDAFIHEVAALAGYELDGYEYAKIMDCFTDLSLGRVDAIILDSTVANTYLAGESVYQMVWIQTEEPETFGIAVKQGNKELQDKLNASLQKLEASGKMDEIRTYWFGENE